MEKKLGKIYFWAKKNPILSFHCIVLLFLHWEHSNGERKNNNDKEVKLDFTGSHAGMNRMRFGPKQTKCKTYIGKKGSSQIKAWSGRFVKDKIKCFSSFFFFSFWIWLINLFFSSFFQISFVGVETDFNFNGNLRRRRNKRRDRFGEEDKIAFGLKEKERKEKSWKEEPIL